MGILRIETSGSFPYRAKHFGAMEWGHAHAVAEAIQWLASEVLPAAIAQDHRLQERGANPRLGWEGRTTVPGEHGPIDTPRTPRTHGPDSEPF